MAIHLIKLCVGADSVEDLQRWVDRRVADRRKAGEAAASYHDTRAWPKRADELLDGGSLYWVIRGTIAVRQRLIGLEKINGGSGQPMCRLMLDPELVRTEPRSKRPFQGWRYLTREDAPADLAGGTSGLSPELAVALKAALAW